MNFDGKENKIEDVKRKLYDIEDNLSERKVEGVLHTINHKVENDWNDEDLKEEIKDIDMSKKNKPKMSIFKKFFILAIIFFLASLGYALYRFYNADTSISGDKIEILVFGNSFAKGGEEVPLQIEIVNKNNASLERANLLVEYPKGASDDDLSKTRLPVERIGTIKPGERIVRNSKVVLYGEEGSVRNIKISLEYHPEGSNAIFTKSVEHSIDINLAPVSVSVDTPSYITSNQDFSFKINVNLNTSMPKGNNILQVYYPKNFIFDSASPSPYIGNASWDLSTLTNTKPMDIEIKGRMIGQEGDEQIFKVYAGASNQSNQSIVDVVYSSVIQTVAISKPFLETKILVNGADSINNSSFPDRNIDVSISWINNLPNRVTDVELVATLSGNVLNKNGIDPREGYYDSVSNKITWTKNTVSRLGNIEPGEKGLVEFRIKSMPLNIGNTIKDPQINIDVSIKGRQPSTGLSFDEINDFVKKSIKINSDLQIASSAKYQSGSMPPKADTETKYIVTWTLSNTSNTINQAVARSVLPVYVSWVGLSSGSMDRLSFNEATREVIWDIGNVRPNTGFDTSREVSFVISLRPSLSQVGSVPQLMKEVYLSGIDSFTGNEIKSNRSAMTTLLSNDSSFKFGFEKVVN